MDQTRPRIAVVDDEEPIRTALRRLLRSAGMDAEVFASGTDFLQSTRTPQPDCVVLDLHMAGLSGFEVQAQLKRSGNRLPVVVITGHDTPESRQRAIAGGAAAYLLKPVDGQMLLDAINAAIAGRGTEIK